MGGPAAVSTSNGNGRGYAHLIDRAKPWWKNARLVKLNLCIMLLYVAAFLRVEQQSLIDTVARLITSTTNGYDGSMMSAYFLALYVEFCAHILMPRLVKTVCSLSHNGTPRLIIQVAGR